MPHPLVSQAAHTPASTHRQYETINLLNQMSQTFN